MFSSETLPRCAIIKISDLLPKRIRVFDNSTDLKDGFLFLGRSGKKLLVYQNLGFDITDQDREHLIKFISTWGGGETVEIRNGILEMELPSFLVPFLNEINSIAGSRVSPNLLRISGDVYICVEFHDNARVKVSNTVMDFASKNHIFEKNVVYMGKQPTEMPYLLKIYADSGNNLEDLTLVNSIWEFTDEQIVNQNLGVFQNQGSFVPKHFIDDTQDILIFKMEKPQVLGNGKHEIVDPSENMVEIAVTSKFFSDFYNEVIKGYSGPLFYQAEVTGKSLTTHFLVESDLTSQFLKGLLNHWKKEVRADHRNFIYCIQKFDSFLEDRDLNLA
ncbi:MAG: hypothetical protein M1344_03350 [Candidatus Thermoplasmatota archaeon]|jgi:hypothetical protein|nr:hypothetical protein [Candidatus Thermoplasmatota archaeon]